MLNEYENEAFFQQYAEMARSREGLSAAGEWHQLKPLFPPLRESPYWIWAAAMDGTVSLLWSRVPGRCWALI